MYLAPEAETSELSKFRLLPLLTKYAPFGTEIDTNYLRDNISHINCVCYLLKSHKLQQEEFDGLVKDLSCQQSLTC